jgi:hypothetical protein
VKSYSGDRRTQTTHEHKREESDGYEGFSERPNASGITRP